jgi:hypothetical protein
MTPVIIADGEFSRDPVAELFRKASGQIEPAVAQFVYETVKKFPGPSEEAVSRS